MMAGLLAGSVWTHAHPAAPIVAAYEADPAVGALRVEFEPVLRESLITVLRGLLR